MRLWVLMMLLAVPSSAQTYDVLIRGGSVYDGSGAAPRTADVAIQGDRIARIGSLNGAHARTEIDARGLAVSPGFINMLSWSNESPIADGRLESELRQGVTLEVMGEGDSMGPLTPEMKRLALTQQVDVKYDITWTTLREYLDFLVRRGVSMNYASFVGAATVRANVLGYQNRAPNAAELDRMRALVDQAMRDGALGVGSALIYAPGTYAKTDELVALCEVAAKYGGMYISHLRSEGDRLLEAIDELIEISRRAKLPAEIYHFKAAGQSNWSKQDQAIRKVEQARAQGLKITADMYTYTAGATGLDAAMPPWVQEGGYAEWARRLRDPAIRQRVAREMRTPNAGYENLLLAAGSPGKVLLVSFKNPALKPLTGKSLAEVARLRGKSAEETAMDLVIEDGTRVGTVYFLMSEDNLRKIVQLPWMSFGSDEASQAPEEPFLRSNPHPRAYGNFARLLAHYVRDEKLVPLSEAIRRLTSFPASNLKLKQRGVLREGYFADVVVFDPAKIQDHATYDKPHQFATGVLHVLVNGVPVIRDGAHTGAKPGRIVHGPGSPLP